MKILHTSDWHLGRLNGNQPIFNDQKYFINQICEIIKDEKIDIVVIAGDIYDRSIPSADAITLYDYAMDRIVGELNTKAILVAGNHDGATRFETNKKLLKSANLFVCGKLSKEFECVECDDVQIFSLPWFTTDKVKSIYPESADEINSLTDAYSFVCNKIKEQFDPTKKHILISHSYIVGAETSTSDRSAEVGTATAVNAGVFNGFDYVALGHIHKPQKIAQTIRYSGSPMPYAFGKEENQTKQVIVIDTNDMLIKEIPLELLHQRKTLKGTYDELKRANFDNEIKNGYVRLEVTDCSVGLELMSELNSIYPNMIEIQGKSFDDGDATITLSIEQLEELENNPTELFKQFCVEIIKKEASGHMIKLFEKAVEQCEEGSEE